MAATRNVRMLTRYNRWANDLIFESVAKLPPGEATKTRVTLFKNMVHTLNHNYVIDRIFQAHIEGREHGYTARNTADTPSFEDLRRAQREVDDWYVEWSDRVTPAALAERIRFQFVGGGDGAMTPEEMVLHLVNHTSYHRGFVADMFYHVPAKPPTTDITVFVRDVPLDLGD